MSKDCLFCRIVRGEIPSDKVLEDDHVLAFRDVDPQAPIHVLIVPKLHIDSLARLATEDANWIAHLMVQIGELARTLGIESGGYRVVTNHGANGGQTVDHLHFHLLGGRPLGWPPG